MNPLNTRFNKASWTAAAHSTKPVILITNHKGSAVDPGEVTLARRGLPILDGLAPALSAIRHAFAYRDGRARADSAPPAPPEADLEARAELVFEQFVKGFQRVGHTQPGAYRRAAGLFGVVFLEPEQPGDLVADILVDHAVVEQNRLAERGE